MITNFDHLSLPANSIAGVSFKQLKTFADGRGFFRELIRASDPFFADGFGQWSHSKMKRNTVKAWHYHHLQIDWWYLAVGTVHAVLFDNREESPSFGQKLEFMLGDDAEALSAVVKIPPGVLHGCKVLSETAHLFYITSRTYDPNDEGRFPFNSPLVQHNWGPEASLIVAENDLRLTVPTAPRVPLTAS